MAVATWYGTSRRKPRVTRFRDEDGWYGLHVVCWHGMEADLVYPVKETILSWELSCSLIPCSWVNCEVKDVRRFRRPSGGGEQGRGSSAVERFWADLDTDDDRES